MYVLDRWRHKRRLRRAARQMLTARREGLGLFLEEWQISAETLATGEDGGAAEAILDWCRQTIAHCRRPWGIDHFDLTLARSAGSAPVQTVRFRELRPIDLYAGSTLLGQLTAFLSGGDPASEAGAGAVKLAGALFSWGDAADAALAPAS